MKVNNIMLGLMIVLLCWIRPLTAQHKKQGFTLKGSLISLKKGSQVFLIKDTDTISHAVSNGVGGFILKGFVPDEIGYYCVIINSGWNNLYKSEKFLLVNRDIKLSGFVRESPHAIGVTVEGVSAIDELQKLKDISKTFFVYDSGSKKLNEVAFESAIESYRSSMATPLLIMEVLRGGFIPIDKAQLYYNLLDPFVKTSAFGLQLSNQLKFSIGSKAPDFSGNTPDGSTLNLKKVLSNAKLTMIDFWASWCDPCRYENPNVVKLYKECHDKGFNILGVSLDRDAEKWIEAINKDGLNWYHVSELKGWNSKVARLYGINKVPKTILLDETGTIIAMDLKGESLSKKVKEILEKSN